jgi:glucosamine-6-phosphate deaminase
LEPALRVIIRPTAEAACITAARMIADQVIRKPNSVLGLATGGTPVVCYRELIRLHREGKLDFSQVTSFNLDEYVGLPADHPQSYHTFMDENLFNHINVLKSNIHIPDGMTSDIAQFCSSYEESIRAAGGIDLQLLGIGTDGHIGFNEPGSSLASRTRLKTLCEQTLRDNARFFGSVDDVPQLSITMGVGTILDSRRCILLATGEKKAAAIRGAIEGPITSQNTASALQLHPEAIAILDQAAASWLNRAADYKHAETHMPDPDRLAL